mmetsp:Transcript_27616/g.62592  ORF Transcript_27616/g.62592 Transcript_27616/m.62592 type:complete len:657 (+) Transcript_27616:199-2169(+)
MANPAASGGAATSSQFASLYVGDLSDEVSETKLYEVFNAVGPVASIRVCRDSTSRKSLNYAYVNFHQVADAERALDTLNYSSIEGKPCRIMWSHRDPSLRKGATGNVFVKNLDRSIDNRALSDTFSLFGTILSCKVATDDSGKSKGYGFVHYETEAAAKQAIERVNGMQIGEKTVFVGPFQKRSERDAPTLFSNVYLKHLPDELQDDAKLKAKVADFGEVTSLAIMTDRRGRKFAFCNFKETEAAAKCVEELHQKDTRTPEQVEEYKKKRVEAGEDPEKDEVDYPDYRIYCQRAQSKAERQAELKRKFEPSKKTPQGVNLYIKNLEDSIDDEQLKELFAPFGTTTSVRVMRDEAGKSRGFGFVCFAQPEEATKAVTEMHLKKVHDKPLYVGLAERRDARLARLQQRFRTPGGMGPGGPMGGKGGGPAPMYMSPGMPGGMPGMRPGMPGMPPGGAMGGMPRPGMMPFGMPGMMPGAKGMMPFGGKGMMGPRPGMMPFPGMRPGMPGMMPGKGMPGMMMGKGMPRPPMMGMPGMPGMPGMMARPGMPMFPGMAAARPAPGGQAQAVGAEAPAAVPHWDPSQPLTADVLAAAPPNMQKQMLGEKIFAKVYKLNTEQAGKITGMMLELDNAELLGLLDDQSALEQKVSTATNVLRGRAAA